jgi:leader peptidase (prepilin peptidase) / N-methyltransferase
VAYRVIRGHSILGRSFCPQCKIKLAWYDLIPVVSWAILRGKCRSCSGTISLLYPFIELVTACLFMLLFYLIEPRYWLGYSIFFSALIVTIRTDIETMLISRIMTWGMIPIGLLLSYFEKLPITVTQSIAGAIFGYALLWLIAYVFYAIRKIEGMGEGDLDLLAMIGSFTGIVGVWTSLLIGASLGSLLGGALILKHKRTDIVIAFGPWLACGAIIYVFAQSYIYSFFFL